MTGFYIGGELSVFCIIHSSLRHTDSLLFRLELHRDAADYIFIVSTTWKWATNKVESNILS